MALRHDAPEELVRVTTGTDGYEPGLRYYAGPNPVEGYVPLCARHHSAYDRLEKIA
jgi:hypothetical protein